MKHLKSILLILSLFLVACSTPTETVAPVAETDPEPAPTAEVATEETITIEEEETPTDNPDDMFASDFLGSYEYMNEDFGTVVSVVVDAAAGTRTITSNTLPNHETGEFPNPGNPNAISAQDGFWEYPLVPTFVGSPSFARTPGVAISGVKFEPDTAERVTCESGEVYNIEAIQEFTDLGLDFNNAHVQPTGEYHYHGVSDLLVDSFAGDNDLVHVAFAADGHLIYYSKSGAYQPSYQLGSGDRAGTNCTYTLPGPSGGDTLEVSSEIDGTVKSDWVYDSGYGDLDECNGATIDGQYLYLVTEGYPYVPRCLMGEVAGGQGGQGGPGGGRGQGDQGDQGEQGGQGGGRGQGDQGGGRGGGIDFAAAAETLGVTEEALRDAVGGPPPDFAAAAEILGIGEDVLRAAIEGEGRAVGDDNPEAAAEQTPEVAAEAAVMVDDISTGRLFPLPGDNIFPEGVSYDPATGNFYVGATADGTLFVGNVNGADEMTIFSEGGADGRTAAIGTKVDAEGRLWVAGGRTGQIFVYDTADGSLVATFTTPGSEGFINDIAITEDAVYFTDSFRPTLWRVTDLTQGEAEAWLDFSGTAINYVEGFNLNGIVPSEDGNHLIVVHSGEGTLYHIDIESQAVGPIDTGAIPLTAGDGMALSGQTLFVTRNAVGEIVQLELSDDYAVGTGGEVITSDLFGYPTTIALAGNSFLVANSQFNNRDAPNLPFTVAQIPFALESDAGGSDGTAGAAMTQFQLDAWGDNWFAAYLGEELIVEDSVSITTERSFNSETATFEASYPLQLNFILKDFIEDDTGLEYIGSGRQQMGDGGFIMQLTDLSSGEVVAVSNGTWACTVIHEAPLDKSCENESNPTAGVAPCQFVDAGEPDGWKAAAYDDASWSATTVYSAAAVDPKDGYNNISWDSSAQFVWGPDLETNNTVLCRVTVTGE